MKLRFKRQVTGCYGRVFARGQVIDYCQWNDLWQGKTEPDRIAAGQVVLCYGQGEFDVFGPDDVEAVTGSSDMA